MAVESEAEQSFLLKRLEVPPPPVQIVALDLLSDHCVIRNELPAPPPAAPRDEDEDVEDEDGEDGEAAAAAPLSLAGWVLTSAAGRQRFVFPAGFVLAAGGGSVTVWSGPQHAGRSLRPRSADGTGEQVLNVAS
eukprot:SAG22_NODE_230_length_14595_cov_50.767660_6_plen_134_part_00